jgi:hypothetical protein
MATISCFATAQAIATTSGYAALMRRNKGALPSTKLGRHYFNWSMARWCVVYRLAPVQSVMGDQSRRIGAVLSPNASSMASTLPLFLLSAAWHVTGKGSPAGTIQNKAEVARALTITVAIARQHRQ